MAAASLRARGEVRVNLVAQGPLGAQHMRFNSVRMNSIQTVEQYVSQIALNNPPICEPTRIRITREYYSQGTAKKIADILRIAAPRLDPNTIDIVVSSEIDLTQPLRSPSGRIVYFIEVINESELTVQNLPAGCCLIRCDETKLQGVLEATQLSTILFRCFPFTIVESTDDRKRFIEVVCAALTSRGCRADDDILSCTGLPATFLPGFASSWLSGIVSLFDFEKLQLDPKSAARFIVKSWEGQVGAISERSLLGILSECITELTNHRPPNVRVRQAMSALEAILSGQAVLLASLAVPSDERQISLATLMRRGQFKRHCLCVLSVADLNSEDVKSFLQERCLEKFDATHLKSLSHLL